MSCFPTVRSLERLTAEERDTLDRYYVIGQSLTEIAADCDRTKAAIRTRIYRAKRKLLAALSSAS